MARIRTIKPDVCTSESLAKLDPAVCWTWVCLWTQCDDRGRYWADPRILKGHLYPLREEMSVKKIGEHLDVLEAEGKVCRYVGCDGKSYLHVLGWDEHQKIDRPSVSRVPPCLEHERGEKCPEHKDAECREGASSTRVTLAEPREDASNLTEVTERGDFNPNHSAASPREGASSTREDASTGPRTLDLGPRTVDRGPIAPKNGATKQRQPKTVRAPDPVWDAMLAACRVDPSGINDMSRGGYNTAAKALRDSGALPEEIRRRAAEYRRRWPDTACTPPALAKHWPELGAAQRSPPTSAAVNAVPDIPVPPPEVAVAGAAAAREALTQRGRESA